MYFPADYGTSDSNNEFLDTIAELEGFLSSHEYDNVIICGDFNVDFCRPGHNHDHLMSFMRDYNLICADLNSSIKYTYRRDDCSVFSWPDHVLTLAHHAQSITRVSTLESVDNFSDHLPLVFTLDLQHHLSLTPNHTTAPSAMGGNDSNHAVNWEKVTDADKNNFCEFISSHLSDVPESLLLCCDSTCSAHFKILDDVCSKLLKCIEDGAKKYLPKLRQKRPVVPGWNDSARPLCKSAKFWHRIWLECGCPISGVLFQIKKNAKKRYKYEVRRLRRQEDHIRSELMGQALSQSRTRDFWKEVRRLTKSSKGRRFNAPVIDGLSNQDEIADMFSERMQDLLNSTSNVGLRSKVLSDLNASLNQADLTSCSISITTVIEALSHLKLGKSDGTALISNHFICASSVLSAFLSKLFTAMLRHGYVPKSLRDCILQPIPKPGKDSSVSDNYRSIALAPTLSKVFEWCILIQFHAAFITSGHRQ